MHTTTTRSSRVSRSEFPIFRGSKISTAITYKHRWHLALLIKLSLDLDVVSISFDDDAPINEAAEKLPLIVSRRSHETPLHVVGIHDDHEAGLAADQIHELYRRSDILDDPERSNALAVWANRNHLVDLALRMRIFTAMHTRVERMTFETLRSNLDVDITRLTTALSLMRIEGLMDFDLSKPIEPWMNLHLV